MTANQVTDLARAGTAALEAYIGAGNIEKLNEGQRIALYRAVCDSLGLNPLTQPFEYLRLSGGLQLYAKKSCTEQLRAIHGVSVTSLESESRGDLIVMVARVRDRSGREDIATGAVNLAGLRGEALANAIMKCETKAKRRATLSICGLAMLDETEVDSIPGATVVSVSEAHGEPAQAAPEAKPRRKALPAPATAPAAPAAVPAPEPGEIERDVLTVTPAAKVAVVQNAAGRKVWRIDEPSIGHPIAVLDERLASSIEAEQAFKIPVRLVCELRGDRFVAISLSAEKGGADVPF